MKLLTICATVALLASCQSQTMDLPAADVQCPTDGRTVRVATTDQLAKALGRAKPGQRIVLADGNYRGNFTAKGPATRQSPIQLCGTSKAVLNGGTGGYTLHLDHADYWQVSGLTLSGGQKGIVLDHSNQVLLDGLRVSDTAMEAVHLRKNSSNNRIAGLQISRTGLDSAKYGEGIYVGSAKSNWCRYTKCQPDASNGNVIVGNTIGPEVTAEAIDVKEGTSHGLISGNKFDGTGMSAAVDSWVDVKGNDWTVGNNEGQHSRQDGMQVQSVVSGWGLGNAFEGNRLRVDADGYGIRVDMHVAGRVRVDCSNRVTGARLGLSNVACTPPM